MAKIMVNPEYNIWEIVRLSGIDSVIVKGDNASFTFDNGELTVHGVTQDALEQGLAMYDHNAWLAELNAPKPPTAEDRIKATEDLLLEILLGGF